MKHELLSVHNLSAYVNEISRLENVSFQILGGESVGFLGLSTSGRQLLVDILTGETGYQDGNVYLNGKPVRQAGELGARVYKITGSNYAIGNWTVAEYIGLVTGPSIFGLLPGGRLAGKINRFLRELGLETAADRKMKNLSEIEKRLVDLAKAVYTNKSLMIVEDEFEGCTTKDILLFRQFSDPLRKNGAAIVINCHSDHVARILSDSYIIFNNGRIVKKCAVEHIRNNRQLETFLMGPAASGRNQAQPAAASPAPETQVYAVCGLQAQGLAYDSLTFYSNEVVSIVAKNTKMRESLFSLLCGRKTGYSLRYSLEGIPRQLNHITDFVRHKIVSIANPGRPDELLLRMSIEDNLVMPSLEKIPIGDYQLNSHRLGRALYKQIDPSCSPPDGSLDAMSSNDYIVILLERWYVFRPKVLIILEPFTHCDLYGAMLIRSYIQKFRDLGTAVVLISSREEKMEEVPHRTLSID